jgi:multiple sugar transport system substrate-binding protein
MMSVICLGSDVGHPSLKRSSSMNADPQRNPGDGLSRRSFLGLSAAVGVTLLATAACGAGGSGSSSGSKTLNVLCEGGGKLELTAIAAGFKQKTGTTVNLIELPYAGLYDRLTSELTSGTPSFDVAAGDAIWLPLFASKLQPLDSLFTNSVKADLFPATLAEGQINGKFYGMPGWTNAEILLYRKDLFENPREQAAFKAQFGYELQAPTTWQQFTDAARFFTRPASGASKALYGTDVKGAVETEFLAHVLQAGSPGVVLDDSGNVIIDNDAHLQALTFYSDLTNRHHVAPPGAKQMDWTAAQNLFNQGSTAMTRFWAHAYRQVPPNSAVYGKVGAAPMIGGSAGIAGIPGPFYLMVPQGTSKTDLAKQFISYAYDNNAEGITSSLGLASRVSAYAQYEGKPGYESFKPLLTTLQAPSTKARPATPKWQQIVDTVLVPMLQKSVTPGADYAGLLKSARQQVEALVK